jgi:hypothetical protein
MPRRQIRIRAVYRRRDWRFLWLRKTQRASEIFRGRIERWPRMTQAKTENTYESILTALAPLITDDASAREVYAALHEVAWVPIDSRATTYSEAFDLMLDHQEPCFYWGWRDAGEFIAKIRGCDESYMDVQWDFGGRSGEVSERIQKLMASLGLKPTF